jgi:putative transposase
MSLLNTVALRNLFVRELERVRDEMKFLLVGYVVMPNHVHLLMSEPPGSTPSKVLHNLKLDFSRKVRKERRNEFRKTQVREPKANLGHPQLPFEELPRAFWQARFYDFNVYSKSKLREKLNYMHANPVVRGLVKHPKDWPWSSWSFYEKNEPGLIRIGPV